MAGAGGTGVEARGFGSCDNVGSLRDLEVTGNLPASDTTPSGPLLGRALTAWRSSMVRVTRQTMFSAISACSRADPYADGVPYERRATNHHTVASTSTATSAIEA